MSKHCYRFINNNKLLLITVIFQSHKYGIIMINEKTRMYTYNNGINEALLAKNAYTGITS